MKHVLEQQELPDDASCEDLMDCLFQQISELPVEQRGAEALRLTSQLLEFAAFELAGILGSEKAGVMIECAAQLSDESVEHTTGMNSDKPARRRVIQ